LKVKTKIINLKLDGLQKHVRRKKTLIYLPGVLVGESYISNDNQHQKNERAMKGLMLAGLHILLQSWWLMEGRQKKKLSNLWQFFIS
jgi:hypothetical protein